ncbi:MAG: ATP-dependent helicase [Planctomycetes bacterium]|nr:ATP-dependent helicase [Planctomycetota bacterium]
MTSLNANQQAAVAGGDHRCLISCPGSGKTRTLVAKLVRCVDAVRDSTRKLGCITYTNSAVHEIERRLRKHLSSTDHECCEISTIHSFSLNNILRPYHHLLPEFESGFEIVPPDDPSYKSLVSDLVSRHSIPPWAVPRFEGLQRYPDGRLHIPDGITQEAAEDFVQSMDESAQTTLPDIVYHSCRLIEAHQHISRGLAARFAWLLIDEFQDTSTSQVVMLKEIARHGHTHFFFVGDPNQSIYEFSGARPELMQDFADHVSALDNIRLTGNYRSSSRIIAYAERLCPCTPPMQGVGQDRDCPIEPRYIHCGSILEAVWEHFVPALDELGIPLGDAAVLAPQWFSLLHLARDLRDREVPVIGPGARPYRRSREFAQFAEHACAYLEDREPRTALATHRALFIMLLNISGEKDWRVYSFEGKMTLLKLLLLAQELREQHPHATEWLAQAGQQMEAILVEDGFLPAAHSDALTHSAQEMIDDIRRNVPDAANLSTEHLGLFARPSRCLRLMTMHRAKGQEFDAVAIVDLHDDKVPHFSMHGSPTAIAEARRLLYVATTRARKLVMWCSDTSNARNEPCRFLGPDGLELL